MPDQGLFWEEKRGQKSLAEQQVEMKRKQKMDHEAEQRNQRLAEAARLKEKQQRKEAALT